MCNSAYHVYNSKGIARRNEHKPYPEPEVAMIFKKSETDNTVDLFKVEMGLKKAYQEVSSRNCDAAVCVCERMSSEFLQGLDLVV